MSWKFYGRKRELEELQNILSRRRWFFAKLSGRRRIGKTALIQEALRHQTHRKVFYVQIPDSAPAGVLSAVADAMETFEVKDYGPPPRSLNELGRFLFTLIAAGYIVTLDEFQYFNKTKLKEFASILQKEIDVIASSRTAVEGGLFVLGSIHTEMVALLDDRSAPLYNRTTDEVNLTHLDFGSLKDLLSSNGGVTPEKILFLWNLFEGVPKFYRDCFERDALTASRSTLLMRMFFESSSPLKNEAENWFLKELQGRYDAVLKFVARNPGCPSGEIEAYLRNTDPDANSQVGGYLQTLIDKYGLIEKRLPIFAKPTARNGRYYVADNFLRSWLGAIAAPVSAIPFSPVPPLIKQADERLMQMEGYAFEKMVAQLHEERSRKGLRDFELSQRIEGYWDRKDVEIDFVALDRSEKRIRFGNCKRSEDKIEDSLILFNQHIERFLLQKKEFSSWTIEKALFAPTLSSTMRNNLAKREYVPQDLNDLLDGL